jgi:hypothetical protein
MMATATTALDPPAPLTATPCHRPPHPTGPTPVPSGDARRPWGTATLNEVAPQPLRIWVPLPPNHRRPHRRALEQMIAAPPSRLPDRHAATRVPGGQMVDTPHSPSPSGRSRCVRSAGMPPQPLGPQATLRPGRPTHDEASGAAVVQRLRSGRSACVLFDISLEGLKVGLVDEVGLPGSLVAE